MKTIHILSLMTVFSIAVISCKKNELPLSRNAANTISTEPAITSKIFTHTNNPFAVTFGQAEAVFNTGDKVAVYLPYGINNDVLIGTTISLTDASTEEVLGSYDLLPSSHPSISTLGVPYDLSNVPFRFIVINIDNNYSGRTITMTTTLTGQMSSSIDVLSNAFSVQ